MEPVGVPYREICVRIWKGNLRMFLNRIDGRDILLLEEKYFHVKSFRRLERLYASLGNDDLYVCIDLLLVIINTNAQNYP